MAFMDKPIKVKTPSATAYESQGFERQISMVRQANYNPILERMNSMAFLQYGVLFLTSNMMFSVE